MLIKFVNKVNGLCLESAFLATFIHSHTFIQHNYMLLFFYITQCSSGTIWGSVSFIHLILLDLLWCPFYQTLFYCFILSIVSCSNLYFRVLMSVSCVNPVYC